MHSDSVWSPGLFIGYEHNTLPSQTEQQSVSNARITVVSQPVASILLDGTTLLEMTVTT